MQMDSTNSIGTETEGKCQQSAVERRTTLFTLGLIRTLDISNLTYIIILLIELLQIISILISGNFYLQWEGAVFYYFRIVVNFISIAGVIHQYPNTIVGLLITVNVFLLLFAGAIGLMIKYGSDMLNMSQLEKIAAKIMAFIMVLFKNLLQIPFFYFIVCGFSSDADNKNLIMGLSLTLVVLLLPFLFYVTFLFTDLNPFSPLIFAGQSYPTRIINSLIKLSLVLYSALDKSHKSELQVLILILIVKVAMLFINNYLATQNFNKIIKKYQQWQDHVIIWFILFLVISYYTFHGVELFVYLLIIIVASLLFINYLEEIFQDSLLTENFMQLEDTRRIENHILRLIQLIDTIHERSSRILLEGHIAFHARNCNLPTSVCTCKQVSSHSNPQLESRKYMYYEFIIMLLKSAVNRTNNPRRIYLLLSYVFHYKLKNRFQTIHSLLRSKDLSKSLLERLESLSQIKVIEQEIGESESKKNSNVAVDIMRFLKFNLKIVEFERTLDECCKNHIDFWNQILEINLNIQKLQNCGAVIAKQKQFVKSSFHEMLQLNKNNAHIMILYGQFLSWVCNEDFENTKLLEKGETIIKNLKQSSKINDKNEKYSENAQTSIIVISCNQKQLGKIVQTNNFVKSSIGYHRKQLISQNISMLMPKIFAEYHTLSLQRYLLTSKDKYVGQQRLVPVLDKEGYIIPSLAFTKQIPNLEDGIQIVGFLSGYNQVEEDDYFDEKVSYIVYDCNSEVVMGISKNCYLQYGIPKCLVYGNNQNSSNQLKIKHIFGVSLEKNESGFEKEKEIMATIDTKALKNQFVIVNTVSTRKLLDDVNLNVEVRTHVIIKSIFQLNYHGFPLRMISITKNYNKKQESYLKRKSIKSERMDFQKEERSDAKSESDDLKNLKDFKNFISIKREPKAIRFISLVCLVLIFIFYLGAGGFITLHIREFGFISSTMEGIRIAFLNRMYLTELSFEFQKVYINHNQDYPSDQFPQASSISKMKSIIKSAKEGQLKLLPIKNYLGVQNFSINYFDFYPNSSYRIVEKSIDEAITIQISKFYFITNDKGDYLKDNPLNYNYLTVTNFMQTKYSEVFSFISACNQVQEMITNEGFNKNEKTKLFLIIVTVSLIVFTLIWIIVSLPKTLQVVEINSKVLSLFNLISPEDVRCVINRCFIFQTKYLVESNVDQEKVQEYSFKYTKEPGFSKRRSVMYSARGGPPINLNASGMDTSSRIIMPALRKVRDAQSPDNFEDSSNENKMIDKGNKDKKKAVLTFLFVFFFLTAYASLTTGYLITQYDKLQNEAKTMNIIYNRTAQFQQIKTAYTKYLIDRTLNFMEQTISSINLNLIGKIYDTERQLLEESISSSFSSIINSLNTQNLCDLISDFRSYKVWGSDDLTTNQCQQVDNGILTRGIKTSLVTIMEQIRSMILLPEATKLKLDMHSQTVSAIQRYTQLEKYIVRPLIMISQYIAQKKIENELTINIIFYTTNSIFMVLILLFWRFAWRRYLEYLNESVWRTKSMLNVIPSKIITNNQLLMSEFTSGQLEKIVR